MERYFFWTFMLAIVSVLSVGIAVFLRAYLTGTTASALLFRPRAARRRLEIVEHASLDGKRKLVLIRRDDVEHLLMTGGPVDVVVETGIAPPAQPVVSEPESKPNVFARRPPVFARAAPTADREINPPEL